MHTWQVETLKRELEDGEQSHSSELSKLTKAMEEQHRIYQKEVKGMYAYMCMYIETRIMHVHVCTYH